jgi:Family of unknown function (DUF6364)
MPSELPAADPKIESAWASKSDRKTPSLAARGQRRSTEGAASHVELVHDFEYCLTPVSHLTAHVDPARPTTPCLQSICCSDALLRVRNPSVAGPVFVRLPLVGDSVRKLRFWGAKLNPAACLSSLYVSFLRYNTYMSKLTLSVDGRVVSSAKRYAKQHGISVSEMVEAYLAAVASSTSPATRDAPILRSVRGSLRKADLQEYRKHLAIKYR